jgi:hypothetical protein
MSADRFKLKRGTTAAVNAYLPQLGEPVVDLTTMSLKIGDGTTLGGVGLSLVASAVKLATMRNLAFTGDATGTMSFDGSANSSAVLTLAPSGVTAGTFTRVTVDAKGRVTAGQVSALAVANGGTGVTTVAAQVAPLQTAGLYGQTNVLGTVSQASGVPTGALIESGSNANGFFVKYADGTMICRATPTAGITQTTANVAVSANFTLPATFVGVYNINVNLAGVDTNNNFNGYSRGLAISTSVIQIVQCWSVVQLYSYSYIAIGRWY